MQEYKATLPIPLSCQLKSLELIHCFSELKKSVPNLLHKPRERERERERERKREDRERRERERES